MAKLSIKSENQQQMMLLPPSYEELVPKCHPVRVINSVINSIDIGQITKSYVSVSAILHCQKKKNG